MLRGKVENTPTHMLCMDAASRFPHARVRLVLYISGKVVLPHAGCASTTVRLDRLNLPNTVQLT